MYPVHSLKSDPDGSGCIAIKTALESDRNWRVFRPDGLNHLVYEVDVSTWVDMVPADSAS